MSTLAKSATICLLAGSTFTLAAAPATAQQDAEAIRGKCIAQASKSFPGPSMEGPESRARVETYISCMRQHGLNP